MSVIALHDSAAEPYDRRALRARAERFQWHHRERLLATLAKLNGTRRDIVAALPTLFHFNQASIPGYHADAPSGVRSYEPDGISLSALRRLAPGLNLRSMGQHHALDALFLMGSGGSTGHTADSDIDVWVCCDASLHDALRAKVSTIEAWAGQRGLTLQIFLVDPAFFHDPKDTTHSPMLLDEFYRSSIWLAGAQPLWWYVDGAPEQSYQSQSSALLHVRAIDRGEVLDFGPVGQPTPKSLARAAIRELTAAFHTPYKSLLKLALIESYLDAPQAPLLSNRYQQLINGGENDPAVLDTYSMLYEHLEAHGDGTFSVDDARALFVRRILPRARRFKSHETLMERFRGWGLRDAELKTIRNPSDATYAYALTEYARVVGWLEQGVQIAQRFLLHAPGTADALAELEAKLSSLKSSQRPDADLIPQTRPKLEAERRGQKWRLKEQGHVHFSAASYVDLLVWVHTHELDTAQVRLPSPWFSRAWQSALAACQGTQVLFLINPLPDPFESETQIFSANDDPLSYGGLQVNLLRQACSVDLTASHPEVAHHPDPVEALAAFNAYAAGSRSIRFAAPDQSDAGLVRRMDGLLTQARDAFSRDTTIQLSFGRGTAELTPRGAHFTG